ncbi:hypothetical protein AN964_14180 [Heyndrickxia shackletonii]|uniref:Uncharacterized protein n=1 Tax=Heyndrickxia shackletonii TaxID=157838 RepID=A0A0Q3TKL7_9BACI|nr:hypothetical protein [Heyndrickxia shackletonii]KQL54528.1 hypothetical protein AN964_14180 [Heyndrickxia shackletonii]NEZ02059.1 hypothetical protein [Heyndrickxia shackletonii]
MNYTVYGNFGFMVRSSERIYDPYVEENITLSVNNIICKQWEMTSRHVRDDIYRIDAVMTINIDASNEEMALSLADKLINDINVDCYIKKYPLRYVNGESYDLEVDHTFVEWKEVELDGVLV